MKKSVAYNQFPQVVAQDNRFWLFNPILKKRYENRPEERVRLRWVEYLLLQTSWKKNRIGFETPVRLRQSKNTLRADLVLYADNMKPNILIECKSNSVKLSHSSAEQAARYNSEVNADYLVLTNGVEDYWFEKTGEKIGQTTNVLNQITSFTEIEKDVDYWYRRGFCSSQPNSELNNWLIQALNFFWSDEMGGKRKYLDFQTTVLPVPMNQFYKLFEIDSDQRLAITFIGTDSSDTLIIGVLNETGINKGICCVNLDQLQSKQQNAVTVISGDEKRSFSAGRNHGLNISDFQPDQIKNLPKTIMKFFD
ncbi:MAG: type I restriction enzyme HsdR N-terminal domain-containing protein [Balneolaceae bacterium]|nr:type I restriction enzyme HsdR N-terminal domain-containing protein [Balneolaceae bacterium]